MVRVANLPVLLLLVLSCHGDQSVVHDSIAGGLLLAAYGDALGAAHETVGLSRHSVPATERGCELVPAHSWYNQTSQEQNTWGVWPPTEAVSSLSPVTDDTMWKWAFAEPFLAAWQPGQPEPVNETSLKLFLKSAQNDEHRFGDWSWPGSWWAQQRQTMGDDILQVFQAGGVPPSMKLHYGHPVYFNRSSPEDWGLYLHLSTAFAYGASTRTPISIAKTFSTHSQLDSNYDRSVLGSMAATIALAVRHESDAVDLRAFSTWFLQSLTKNYIQPAVSHELLSYRPVVPYWSSQYALGEKLRQQGASADSFIAATLNLMYVAAPDPEDPTITQDAAVMVGQMLAISAYSSSFEEVFAIMSGMVGDTDTVTCYYGQVLGAYFGRSLLLGKSAATRCGNSYLADQLAIVSAGARTVFGRSLFPDDSALVYERVGALLST